MQYIECNKNVIDFQYCLLFGQKLSTLQKKNGPDTGIIFHSFYTNSKIGAVHTDTLVERNIPTLSCICKAM